MNNIYTYDADLKLRDAGLVAASAAAQVSSAAKVLDLGPGFVRGDVVIDLKAIEVATGDELYQIEAQFSSSPTFASDILVGPVLKLGDSSVTNSSADSALGRYVLPVINAINGTTYQYFRLFDRISGTVATGISYDAFLGVVHV